MRRNMTAVRPMRTANTHMSLHIHSLIWTLLSVGKKHRSVRAVTMPNENSEYQYEPAHPQPDLDFAVCWEKAPQRDSCHYAPMRTANTHKNRCIRATRTLLSVGKKKTKNKKKKKKKKTHTHTQKKKKQKKKHRSVRAVTTPMDISVC